MQQLLPFIKHRFWVLAGACLLAITSWAQSPPPGPPTQAPAANQVTEFFTYLLEPKGFPARWHCGHWTNFHGWLYILSDLLIWAAYFVIPFLLISFIRQRRDVPFDRLFWLFGLFIMACGATHLLDALIFWVPVYRLSGLVRLVTAVASWGTVWALVAVMPKALLLKTPPELEGIVQARTAELAAANQQLQEVAKQLARRNEEFATLANAIPQLAWMAEADGHVFWYNQRWYDYTGTSLEEMLGWGWQQVHHPEHIDCVMHRWRKHLAAGEQWEDTFPLRRADGQYRWFLSRAQPVHNEKGQVTRWFGTNTDVTEMRELQQQVERSEAQFRALMESIPQLVWSANNAGELCYCDGRTVEYTGITAEVWLGQPWLHLLAPDDQPAAHTAWLQVQQAGSLFEGEYRLRRHDGHTHWFLVQAHKLHQTDEQAAQWFGTCTDINEQHTLHEALQAQNTELARTNRDLDTFVYAASHDLKQPVQNLAGLFAELERTATFTDPEAGQMLSMADEALETLLSTIEALTEVVRAQRPSTQLLPPEPVQLQSLVEEVIRLVQNLGPKKATWEIDFTALPAVLFVRVNLRSILYNLLSNAIKYASPQREAHIIVRSELHEGMAMLIVEDNGLGIDLERYGPEVFQLFRRFHDHVPGSGVGLYLTRRIVEQAGGRLEIESEVGKGSKFRILLPAT